VYGPEITTCRYKGLLQEYVKLSYGFPTCLIFTAKVSPTGRSCTRWAGRITMPIPIPPSKTLPIVFLISKQAAPYRKCGGACCPEVSTPKNRSLADSSTTCHDGIKHLHHSNYCSKHSIDPHMVKSHLDGWETTSLTLRYKPNSTS
jgi:hypothetical protein